MEREKLIKVFEILLEEQNGFSKKEAKELASDNEGSELWERLKKI